MSRRSMDWSVEGMFIERGGMVQCGMGKDVGNKWTVDFEMDIDDTRSCGAEMLGSMPRYVAVVCRSR